MHYIKITPSLSSSLATVPQVVWAHGWGQSHLSLYPLANQLKEFAVNWLLDLPGFGKSTVPDPTWGTIEYAQAAISWMKQYLPPDQPIIWIGHSFGCRIGIRIAALEPKLIQGLCLIASPGLQVNSFAKQLTKKIKIYTFKLLKHLCNFSCSHTMLAQLRHKFGSKDYCQANPIMRQILIRVINEDLSIFAQQIYAPTMLIYGDQDQETPVKIGEKLNTLIKNSKLYVLPQQDHWSLLDRSTQQVAYLIKSFLPNYNLL